MIREATVSDSARIAEIDVISSRYAYKNVVPDEYLYQDMSVESRIPVHRKWIAEKRFGIYVYEDSGTGIIRGMMGTGMCEDEDKKGAFELHYLYVDPAYTGTGIGTEMMQFFEQKGRDQGCREFVVWVLKENETARRFYEKNNYCFDGKEKIFKRWNKREVRYVTG